MISFIINSMPFSLYHMTMEIPIRRLLNMKIGILTIPGIYKFASICQVNVNAQTDIIRKMFSSDGVCILYLVTGAYMRGSMIRTRTT